MSRAGGGSLAVSIALHVILLAIGLLWILQTIPEPTRKDIPFSGGKGAPAGDPGVPKKQRQLALSQNPRVAVKGASATFSLPEPESGAGLDRLAPLDGGGSAGLSAGGMPGGGGLQGSLGKGPAAAMFFETEIRAQRIVYVLDFSMTMVGERDQLMRRELAKSLKALPPASQYAVICFSGPVWLPGDEVSGGTVRSRGKTYEWSAVSPWEWKTRSPMIEAPWIQATAKETQQTLKQVDAIKPLGGTDWEAPLEVAIAMEPPPQMVFFMTDGVMEQRDMNRLVRGIAAKAKARGVAINTIAMMEPGAEEPMAELAKRTGGKFTVVGSAGAIRKSRNLPPRTPL